MDIALPVEFTSDVQVGMVDALAQCYAWTQSNCDPAAGRGSLWVALTVAAMIGSRLRSTLPAEATVIVGSLSAEVRIGRQRVRAHKVGRSTTDEVGSSFPGRSPVGVGMATRNRLQGILELPGIDQPVTKRLLWEPPSPTDWILAHMGNGVDGLQAVYLCVPWESDGKTITGWRGWSTLHRADGLDAAATQPGLPIPPPPAVGISLPPIDLIQELNADSDVS